MDVLPLIATSGI